MGSVPMKLLFLGYYRLKSHYPWEIPGHHPKNTAGDQKNGAAVFAINSTLPHVNGTPNYLQKFLPR
jgi:hypothetical protein